jgi:hypothetical protein
MKRPRWLADDPVLIGPVCGSNSLLTGKITGIVSNFGHGGAFWHENVRPFQRLAGNSLPPAPAVRESAPWLAARGICRHLAAARGKPAAPNAGAGGVMKLTQYTCDGFHSVAAADITHAAQLFAVQLARRKYGPKGRCIGVGKEHHASAAEAAGQRTRRQLGRLRAQRRSF